MATGHYAEVGLSRAIPGGLPSFTFLRSGIMSGEANDWPGGVEIPA